MTEPASPSWPSSTLRQKLKSSLCLPSPFRKTHVTSPDKPSLIRSTSSSPKAAWIKSRANEIPELKDNCVSFISRLGKQSRSSSSIHHHHSRGRSRHHRRHSISADFHYDALSYSLNFDEGFNENQVDEFPLRSFSSRLPPSPTREIECRS